MPKLPSKEKLKERGFKQYLKTEPVWAKKMDKAFKCDTLEGDNIKGKAGDYLCLGIDGETWPIDKSIFERTYKEKK